MLYINDNWFWLWNVKEKGLTKPTIWHDISSSMHRLVAFSVKTDSPKCDRDYFDINGVVAMHVCMNPINYSNWELCIVSGQEIMLHKDSLILVKMRLQHHLLINIYFWTELWKIFLYTKPYPTFQSSTFQLAHFGYFLLAFGMYVEFVASAVIDAQPSPPARDCNRKWSLSLLKRFIYPFVKLNLI